MGTFKDATTDATLINIWFMEKDINYDIRTGVEIKDSGKMLVVIDVDNYKKAANKHWKASSVSTGRCRTRRR